MALNKLKYNSLNLTPAANKAISFDSDADALEATLSGGCLLYTSPSPRDGLLSRMPSSA